MTTFRRLTVVAIGILFLVQPTSTRADDILQNVPHDALGFIVIKDLNATDSKVGQLLTTFNAQYPSPLVFLEAVTGIREGLDADGDFLIAMLPSNGGRDAAPQYCVWLPVTDYNRLLTLLEATPGDTISAIRVADEDLLIARQGSWAVIMDPDQRPRMEQMLKAGPNPPAAVNEWQTWINEHDLAVVLLRSGIQQILEWSAAPPKTSKPGAEEPEDDLFGQLDDAAENDALVDVDVAGAEPMTSPLYEPVRAAIHKWVVRSPKLKELVSQAEAIGAATRLDGAGNAASALRFKSTTDYGWTSPTNGDIVSPPTIFEKGDFIVYGGGTAPREIVVAAASVYVRKTLEELRTNDRIQFDQQLAEDFHDAVVAAAADVTSWSVLHRPGDLKTGIYNNDFFLVRASSAKQFIEHAADAMDQWNTMNREVDSDVRYVYDIEKTKVGDRMATQFLLDVAATVPGAALPEFRQVMEKFFGPGGKMRLWLVPIDEQTVLLATATPEQIAAAAQALDRKIPVDWNMPEFAAARKLLPDTADWRVFGSPRAYFEWKRRETEAMNNGVPVIGAKPDNEFPASPLVAFSGKAHEAELEVNVVVPADTIKAAGTFFKK